MKKLNVIAAGLGWHTLEKSGSTEIAGLKFSPAQSCFPAVTCVAQADLRTGLTFADHGLVANGWWSETLRKPLFWEQSAKLVKGERVWAESRAKGNKVGLFFFQQSLGEDVDAIISPAPIHKHGGGMVMSCYTKPSDAEAEIVRRVGKFPLWRYWGPLASAKVGRKCIDYFKAMCEIVDLDEAYLYLPTLDYAAQKYGPDSPQHAAAMQEFRQQIATLVEFAEHEGATLSVRGDYEITPVTAEPVRPNVILREHGFFKVRKVGGRAYPDFYQSTAFAMCDHELCLIYGEKAAEAASLLSSTLYPLSSTLYPLSSTLYPLLLSPPGSWCEYKWWTDDREAPDFASHVDIHNKPGFDPKELFWFCRGTVKGTHGRPCTIARA